MVGPHTDGGSVTGVDFPGACLGTNLPGYKRVLQNGIFPFETRPCDMFVMVYVVCVSYGHVTSNMQSNLLSNLF